MKFAKVLLVAALLFPSVASAQNSPPPPPVPTNFLFAGPLFFGLVGAPLLLGGNNNQPTPTTGTK